MTHPSGPSRIDAACNLSKPLARRLEFEVQQREDTASQRQLICTDPAQRSSDPEIADSQALAGPWVLRSGKRLLNAASNDYLGLSLHPRLAQAVSASALREGVGSGASRLVCGHQSAHHALEQKFARFKHAQAALVCPTGASANAAVLGTLPQLGDVVFHDRLNHASLFDATRLGPATLRTFAHRDVAALARKLDRWQRNKAPQAYAFVVTDSVFSMDGDHADLPALLACCDRYHATLIVDEAHATGILGPTGAGLAEAQNVADAVPISIATASKALGSLGGIISASHRVIDHLINHARAFIYTTAVPPPQIAGIDAALDVIRDEPERRDRLHRIIHDVREALADLALLDAVPAHGFASPILPLITGSADAALRLAAGLCDQGVLGVAIRPPTVPPGRARVRLTLRADMTNRDVSLLINAVRRVAR